MSETKYIVTFAPHIRSGVDVSKMMLTVIIALLPAMVASVIFYGPFLLIQYLTGIVACVFFEWAFRRIEGKPSNIRDLSSIVTGILLVMVLPAFAPIWLTVLGAFIAIVIGKMVFGGLGQNPFNPALVGRMALMVSFPVQMTAWYDPGLDAISSATVLGSAKTAIGLGSFIGTGFTFNPTFLFGSVGSVGEASALALLVGGLFLIYKKIISWHIPFIFIFTVFILTGLLWFINDDALLDPFTHIFSGGLILGAFFMATDYSSSPVYLKGKVIFAIGCGLITALIRVYGGYPEGVGFAILIMNAVTPLLDRFTAPKPFGEV